MLGTLRITRPRAAVGAIALAGALAGVAGAALIGPGNTLTACVSKDGNLKVVDSSSTSCPGTQTRVRLAAVNADGEVADADRLDGMNSTEFFSGYARVHSTLSETGSESLDMDHHVDCPAGKKAIGGGFTAIHHDDGSNPNISISVGEPVSVVVSRPETDSYYARVKFPHEAPSGFRHDLIITAICANVD